MITQLRKKKERAPTVAKRLPRPTDAEIVNVPLTAAELRRLEDAAHLCRLSVASFLRVLVVEAVDHPERQAAWTAVANKLAAGTPGDPPKKRGRPPEKKKSAR